MREPSDASESLAKIAKIARLVRIMTTRCMEEALYFCTGQEQREDWKHFGLVAQPINTKE